MLRRTPIAPSSSSNNNHRPTAAASPAASTVASNGISNNNGTTTTTVNPPPPMMMVRKSHLRRKQQQQLKQKQRSKKVSLIIKIVAALLVSCWLLGCVYVVVMHHKQQQQQNNKSSTWFFQNLANKKSASNFLRRTRRRFSTSNSANKYAKDERIDMRQLAAELPFDNPDGGVWKQGWDVQPVALNNVDNTNNKENNDLTVIVIPHSHCDPGWIKTFDAYFQQQTKEILSTVIQALVEDKRRTFVWAEISYFEWWWKEQTSQVQQQVRQLLQNKQFEFVTGGWVQPDEANSELYAMEIQLQEGHDWIRATFGAEYIPKYGWSIDPFGYSPTMAWLLQKYGFKAMLIQRVHYAIKKELAQKQQLEFYWRQTWEDDNKNDPAVPAKHDIFTHVMPFFSYDVPHTCGPDPSVCCQFDFHRAPYGKGPTCPWGKPPQPITDDNVQERSLLLLDQYRKKAALYRSNVVLVPLGDDFRYQKPREAQDQFRNHQKIHDYINAHVPGVKVHFGTLSDYFDAVVGSFPAPVLKGSFFTYCDVNEDYWSGYFTSRVFDKALDRKLERVLFAAESMAGSSSITKQELQGPRRALSLFQHHDGVTGTAKSHVVEDYAKRMHDAIRTTQDWLLRHLKKTYPAETSAIEELQPCWMSDAPRGLSQNLCGDQGSIVVYNPLETEQSCGTVVVPGHALKTATIPCEIPGAAPNSKTKLVFDEHTGLMKQPIREEWKVWKVHKGGAYLFFPGQLLSYDLSKDAVIENGGYVVKTENWKRTIVEKQVPTEFGETATVIDFVFETFLDKDNEEWFVRFSDNIASNGIFHTDLNGFNFDTHKFRSDMPIQSQVFPMPTLASIEDDQMRMTVLSEHAQGTASLHDGAIDVWLDRRLAQDDSRGLGQGVQDNRPTRTRLRLVLERERFDPKADEFDVTPLTRRMWNELQHPLEMFGTHTVVSSPASPEKLQKAAEARERERERIRQGRRKNKRLLNETSPQKSYSFSKAMRTFFRFKSIQKFLFGITPPKTVSNTKVPFVYMVHKRVDYLRKAIDSLRKSDFPKTRVPLIISHDGHVPDVVQYVDSIKDEFRIIQLFHPHSCYEHPDSFPGDDKKLNEGYKGDSYGNPRSAWVTCCKHHFTWLLKTVFEELEIPNSKDDSDNDNDKDGNEDDELVDTFLFLEEDYIVAPTIYRSVINGLNVMEQYKRKPLDGDSFFGLALDPTEGGTTWEPTWIPREAWTVSAFHSGPMTMDRNIYKRLQYYATEYCRFDDYNWDWSLVHVQGLGHLPHTLLMPSRQLARHIGFKDGMHNQGGGGDGGNNAFDYVGSEFFTKIETDFVGTDLYNKNAKVQREEHRKGYGGWAHPADHEHCMKLLQS